MSAPAQPRAGFGKVVGASIVGTTVEWYDFFLYGSAAALVFGPLFFPEQDDFVGVLASFATYAIGFAARPIGGLVFGHFGDRIGRKKLLVVSLPMMGGATFAIGLLPTYATVGVLAPILLIALRLVQGFALGGEWGGAVLIVSEHGKPQHRGFWASWPQAGAPAGQLISTGVLALLAAFQSDEAFAAWGWRIPFLLSAVLILVGLWVRLAVSESPVFLEAQRAAEAKAAETGEVEKAPSSRCSPATSGRCWWPWAPARSGSASGASPSSPCWTAGASSSRSWRSPWGCSSTAPCTARRRRSSPSGSAPRRAARASRSGTSSPRWSPAPPRR